MKTTSPIIPLEAPIPPEDDRLIEYRQLRENRLARPLPGAPHGVFIAEGEKVVRLLLEGGLYRPRSLLLSAKREELAREFAEIAPPGVPIYLADQALMDEIVGFPIHRGVLASGVREPLPAAGEILRGSRACLILEGLANHDNVGGMMRLAAALGGLTPDGAPACPVLLDPASCDPLYRKSVRVSMGHALRVPHTRLPFWPGGLELVREAGLMTIALTTDTDATDLDEVGEIARPALLLGEEGAGLSEKSQRLVDVRVRIPMTPGVDSLNVVTAAAIALSRLVDPCEM